MCINFLFTNDYSIITIVIDFSNYNKKINPIVMGYKGEIWITQKSIIEDILK